MTNILKIQVSLSNHKCPRLVSVSEDTMSVLFRQKASCLGPTVTQTPFPPPYNRLHFKQ